MLGVQILDLIAKNIFRSLLLNRQNCMKIAQNYYIIKYLPQNTPPPRRTKQDIAPAFKGKEFNTIKSDFNKALFNIKPTRPASFEEIKDLFISAKEKIKNAEYFKAEYGEISDKFITAMQAAKSDYFTGKNPNFDIKLDDLESFGAQFKTYTEDEKISLATQFANINNGKYIDFWRKNPDKLLFFINNTEYLPSQLKNFNPETWDSVISSFIKIFEDRDKTNIINSIIKYAGDGYAKKINFLPQINKLLKRIITRLENGRISKEEYQKEILKLNSLIKNSKITQYMEPEQEKHILKFTKPLPDDIYISPRLVGANLKNFVLEPMNELCNYDEVRELIKYLKKTSITSTDRDSKIPIWRDDNLSFFDSIDIDGIPLSHILLTARKDSDLQTKVLNYFNKVQPVMVKDSFLSTALKPHEFMKKDIKWNLTLEKGVKYLYIEPLKCFSDGSETELLIHPCKLKINKAEYIDNRLILDADILPFEYSI